MVDGVTNTTYRLKDIFELYAGGDVKREFFSPYKTEKAQYPIYSNSLENSGLYGFTSKPRHKGNSITITGRGSLGHAEYRENDFDAIVRLLVLTPKRNDEVFPKYVTYLINEIISFPIESTGVPQLTTKQIEDIIVSVPEYKEQKCIANALSDIDELIFSLEKLIAKKKAVKQGTMQDLLTGKIRLPGFSREWSSINLYASSKVKARIGWQGLTTDEYLDSGYAYLVTGTDFCAGRIAWDNCHFINIDRFIQDKNIQLQNDDILITKDGSLGKTAMVKGLNKPATLNSGVFVIRPISNAYFPEFVYYVLSSFVFKEFLDQLSAGSTIIHLYQKDLSKFSFNIPETIEEQKAISDVLSNMDNEIESLEKKLAKYGNIKQGMMQQLLTGQIRLA